MEVEKVRGKSKYNTLMCESEIEKAKLESEIKANDIKLSCHEKSQNILKIEMNMIEKRYKQKCDEITEQDNIIRDMKCQIKKLDEEVLSLKSIQIDKSNQPWKTVGVSSDKMPTTERKDKMPTTERKDKVSEIPETHRQHSNTRKDPKNIKDKPNHNFGDNRDKDTFKEKRGSFEHTQNLSNNKHVLMVGTSNTKYLSAKYVADYGRNNLYIKKHLKFSVKEAKDFIEGYEGANPDMLAYLVTCNDLEKRNCDDIVRDMEDLIGTTNSIFGDKPIIVSLPLPRNERDMNLKAQQLSAALRNKLSRVRNVTFSDNCNSTYRGRPLDGILCDKKHLSKWGTEILARNLRDDFAEIMVQKQYLT